MTHLSPSEFADLVDAALHPARASHLERCDACRAEADAARTMMREARTDAVPEPSPLFWDHLQQRVHRAIAAEPSPRRFWVVLRPVPALASVMIVSIAIALASLYPRRAHDDSSASPPEVASLPAAGASAPDPGDDPAWALLRDVASDMAIEDAHAAGMALRPGEAENAVLQLTPDERNELGRLLQAALKRAGA